MSVGIEVMLVLIATFACMWMFVKALAKSFEDVRGPIMASLTPPLIWLFVTFLVGIGGILWSAGLF